MGSCLKNIDVMSIDVRKTKLLTANRKFYLLPYCKKKKKKTLTAEVLMMPNIQMHLLQKRGSFDFKETQIAFWNGEDFTFN